MDIVNQPAISPEQAEQLTEFIPVSNKISSNSNLSNFKNNITTNSDHSNDDDDDDDDEMPPLETIEKEMKGNGKENKKNIVIPDSDKESDQEQSNNDNKGYMDIFSNGDLRKKVIKKADSNIRPQRGSKVVVRLETRIFANDDDGEVGSGPVIEAETFDRFELVLGDNDLHQGLDLLIPLMELHEVARIIISPRFGYGAIGNKEIGIPENAVLDCIVELLDIVTASNNVYGEEEEMDESISPKITIDERLKIGNYKKTRGNFWFERSEYSLSIQCYRGALKYLEATNEELKIVDQYENNKNRDQIDKNLYEKIEELIDKRAQTYNNLAVAQIKMSAFDNALRSVQDSLMLRPNNVKALFRRAKIYMEKGEIEEAIKDLKKALKIDPNSEAVNSELNRLNKLLAKQMNDQKELYRRMMQVKNDPLSTASPSDNQTLKCSENNLNKNQNNNNSNNSIISRFRWPISMSLLSVAIAVLLHSIYFSK